MQLNHVNLPVPNVAETSAFFEKYFDFTCVDVKGDNALAVLHGQDNFVLVIMSSVFNKTAVTGFPDAFHIGFLVDRREQVEAVWERLHAGGLVLDGRPRNMRGIFGFYFHAPGDLLIEVSTIGD